MKRYGLVPAYALVSPMERQEDGDWVKHADAVAALAAKDATIAVANTLIQTLIDTVELYQGAIEKAVVKAGGVA